MPEQVQDKITTYWDARSAGYDDSPGHGIHSEAEHQAWLQTLQALLPAPAAEILDVGTGTGFMALLAAELGHRVTGLDLSEGMLALAREKAAGMASPPVFAIGDAIRPDVAEGSFDAVTNRHLLWTLRDPVAALRNWRAALRPGGRVIAIDSLWFQETDETTKPDQQRRPWAELWDQHYGPDTRSQLPAMGLETLDPLLDMAREAGFAEVRIEDLAHLSEWDGERDSKAPRYALIATR